MKIFNAEQTREADKYTIQNEPISSVDLMERAAERAADKILELYPSSGSFAIFAGPGNNGGDGLVIARLFAEMNLGVRVFIVHFTDNYSNDFTINLKRLQAFEDVLLKTIRSIDEFPIINPNDIIIDALFGSGLSRHVSGFPKEIIEKMNESVAEIVSIDIPSGLFGEENLHAGQTIVKANHTLTFQYPSLSFLFPENDEFVEEFHLIDIGIHKDFIQNTETVYHYLRDQDISLQKRKKYSHKGIYGHALIAAGSYGKAGASVLALKAAHRSGAGLVSAHVPEKNAQTVHICSPDTMLSIDSNTHFLSDQIDLSYFDAIGTGPGIGFEKRTRDMLLYLFRQFQKPIVIDADAITILSAHKSMLELIPSNSILTPHPKEFERLFGSFKNSFQRMEAQRKLSEKYNLIIVLKGAHTSVSCPDSSVYFNSSGNPGMACGGSGDVLTGIITALLAQNYSAKEAALTAVFIHGKAGDMAAEEKGLTALTASDIIDFLPEAFKIFES